MGIRLGENSYGKSRIRLLRVARQEGRHDIKEVTLAIRFEGDFETAHTKGDNRKILPTDTMKNTVYALARQHPIERNENGVMSWPVKATTLNAGICMVEAKEGDIVCVLLRHKVLTFCPK